MISNRTLLELNEPQDYFKGVGKSPPPVPMNILLFSRQSKDKLQQENLQNRSHHRFVLVFNFQTDGEVHIDHLSIPLHAHQALLIHPYQFHHYSQLAAAKLLWLFCTFELQPASFLEPLRNSVLFPGERSEQALKVLLEEWHLCSDSRKRSLLQDEQLQVALTRLLLSLKQDLQSSKTAPQSTPDSNSLIGTINQILSEQKKKPVLIADIARVLSLSESRLRALFKETAGISLGSYIQNHRINCAMALLCNTTRSIADVAEEAGFGSPQAFCRIFKKETGMTPRSYRQQR